MAHPKAREWTLQDLDRQRGYWLMFDFAENRWLLLTQDSDGQWQRVVTRSVA